MRNQDHDRWRRWVVVWVCACLAHGMAWAQLPKIPGLPSAADKSKGEAVAEDPAKRLDEWQKQANETLQRLEEKAAPEGITEPELAARVRDAEQILFGIATIRKEGESLAVAHKLTEDARGRADAWRGFEEGPPYSILMLDELEDELAAKVSKHKLLESSQATLDHLMNTSLEDAQQAEAAIDRAIQKVQTAAPGQEEAAKWRLEAARQNMRLQAVRSQILGARRDTIREQVESAQIEINRVQRMVEVARPETQFLESDVERLKKLSAEQDQRLVKEADALDRRIKSAVSERKKLQPELERLTQSAPESPEAGLHRLRAITLDVLADALTSTRESVDGLVQLEKAARLLQKHRKELWDGAQDGRRDEIVADLQRHADRFRDWENLIKIERESTQAEISNIDARKQSLTNDDPRLALYDQQRAARAEELDMWRRVGEAVDNQRRLVKRWLSRFAPETQPGHKVPAWERAVKEVREIAGAVWSFEVTSFQNSIVVDGETIVGKVPITVSILLKVLVFLWIGYAISTRVVTKVRHGLVGRGIIGEAQAKTLANWVMLVLGFLLLLGALKLLGIPLTVFAFFGGALAIGIGFGTQTLIKNFISGIILLFERKIRVGDIIDVDGIVGTVTEVNTRSSIIRGADEVETMVPNALFLENRVTNWTLTNARQRRSVKVGVAYGSDTRRVMEILKDCADRHGLVCKDPAPFAVFEDFGESALVFILYYWFDFRGEGSPIVVASDLRLMIEKRLAEAGIGVPFPQRDMHLTTTDPIRVQLATGDD